MTRTVCGWNVNKNYRMTEGQQTPAGRFLWLNVNSKLCKGITLPQALNLTAPHIVICRDPGKSP